MQQASDGGYIVAGYTYDSDSSDAYLIKTDSFGNEEWSKTIVGKRYYEAVSVYQTIDGGYIFVGTTRSYGSGFADVLLIKLAPKPKKKPEQK